MDNETNEKKKRKSSSNLLTDERFKQLFTNPDFQVDKTSEEYLLLNPVISQLNKSKAKKLKAKEAEKEIEERIEIDDVENEHNGYMNINIFIIYIYCSIFKIKLFIFENLQNCWIILKNVLKRENRIE